jgi:uncharacterized phage protein (TIGR01671 family)
MREIKFRGLHVQKKIWIYGFLFANINPHKKETEFIDHAIWEGLRGIDNLRQVIPETVGQFTGLKDKKGVKIYEGDIIDEGKVYFDITLLGFFVESLSDEDEPVKPLYDIAFVEILGNIHQNPELLK